MRKLFGSESYQNCHKVALRISSWKGGRGVCGSHSESVDLLWEYSGTLYTSIVSIINPLKKESTNTT